MEQTTAARNSELQAAYWQVWKTGGPLVPKILQRRGLRPPDVEDATQTVALKLLSAFPRMYAQERDALARGEPSPHRWPAFIAHMTHNHVNDLHDAQRSRPRIESLEARQEAALQRAAWDDAAAHPLTDADRLVDPGGIDPAQLAPGQEVARLLRAALLRLPPEERSAAIAFLSDQPDSYEAKRRRVSESTAARRRRRAIDTLQAPLKSAGYSPPGESASPEDTK